MYERCCVACAEAFDSSRVRFEKVRARTENLCVCVSKPSSGEDIYQCSLLRPIQVLTLEQLLVCWYSTSECT